MLPERFRGALWRGADDTLPQLVLPQLVPEHFRGADDGVARWCAQLIELGGGNWFRPFVLGPGAVPVVVGEEVACADPELAVLSAIAHGGGADAEMAVRIALAAMAASAGLDPDRAVLYFDLVHASLSDAARRSLRAMDPAKYEYQSEFAKRYIAQGKAEGRAEGKAEGETRGRASTLLKLLHLKFGPIVDDVAARVQSASIEELDRWAERLLDATSADDTLR